MGKSETTFVAIGGGELTEAGAVLEELVELIKKRPDPRILVLTVATNQPERAIAKYNKLFRAQGIRHVESVDVSERKDSLSEAAVKKVERANALFFTGGDQLNITTLLGGSPLSDAINAKADAGTIIAGTSAGAAMMPATMIISGDSDTAPNLGGVNIAPGMGFFNDLLVDTHFSQRGRHGRLLTAIAHHPDAIGLGIDERTAVFLKGPVFRVVGEGSVTIMDGRSVNINDLPYRRHGEKIAIGGVTVTVLPAGYRFATSKREVIAPALTKIRGAGDFK